MPICFDSMTTIKNVTAAYMTDRQADRQMDSCKTN